MATDPTQGDAPQVDLIAHPDDVSLHAPDTNPALQLAQSLSQTSEELGPFLGQLGGQLQARQAAKATADALRTGGKAFADAVRAGDIEPTQNPWYMHAYIKQAAQVSAQGEVSAFVSQMQSDPSRNDPQAYAAKFQQGLGQIAAKYATSPMAAEGFHAAADPLAAQALNQNTEYNVQRIQQEHVQNTTSLATQAIMDVLKNNPKATPDQVFAATDQEHQTWLNVGGTEPQWRLILKQAVYGAAANNKDTSIIDILHSPYQGSQPIADQADETGKPTAVEMESTKYWIDRGIDADLNQAGKAHQAQIAAEGAKADEFFQQKYGNDYAFGKVPLSQLETDGVAAGYSGNAIVWAAYKQGEEIKGAAGYANAQTELYSTNPDVQKAILKLNNDAVTTGLTPQLSNQLNDMVGRQQLTVQQAESIMDRAEGQTHFNVGEANQNRREAESLKRADAGLALQRFSLVGDAIKQAKAKTAALLSSPSLGIDFGALPAKTREAFDRDVENAGMAVADKGPAAAQEAAENKAAELAKMIIAKHAKTALPTGLHNPNGKP